MTDAGLVVVDVARREDRDLAGRASCLCARPQTRRPAWRDCGISHSRIRAARGLCARRAFFHRLARDGVLFAAFTIWTTTGMVASLPSASVDDRACRARTFRRACTCCLGAQHQVREVDVPRMRRHIRTLGHVARVAQVAAIDDLAEAAFVDAVELRRSASRRSGRTGRKRRAQVDAAAAAVTDSKTRSSSRERPSSS